MEFDG